MEFWGVQVKYGEPAKVKVHKERMVHLSLAALGESKNDKGNEAVPLFLNTEGKKLVIGTLSTGKINQISYDLMLDKDFELSHNWKNGIVYFSGYKGVLEEDSDDYNTDSDSDFGDELPIPANENGEPEPRDEKPKLSTKKDNAAKSKGKIADDEEDSDDDSDEDEDSDESGPEGEPMELSGEDSSEDDDDDDDNDDSSDEEDEETPKKGKKRPAESASKTPVPEKRAKIVTPQKTGDSKKGVVHVATPYPVKKSGKAPTNEKSKSASQVVCKSCSKPFNSESALQSHTKAKHSG